MGRRTSRLLCHGLFFLLCVVTLGCEEEKKLAKVERMNSSSSSSKKKSVNFEENTGGRPLDWRTIRKPLEPDTDPVAPEPNDKAVWAEATVSDPQGFVGLVSPTLANPTLARTAFGTLLKSAYNLDVAKGIQWQKPVHIIWVEPLPSVPTIIASVREPEDVTVLFPEDVEVVRDRAGNDYTLAFSLTSTAYVSFVEREHVVLSPHRADYPLLKNRIATLTSEQPGHFVSFTTSSVDSTDELTRLIQVLGAQNPFYDTIWSAIESFGAAMIPLSNSISLTLDRDNGLAHLLLTISPPPPPTKAPTKIASDADAADAAPPAPTPEPDADNTFLALLDAGETPKLSPLLDTLPVASAHTLLARNTAGLPTASRALLNNAQLTDTFALHPALAFTRPQAILDAERSRSGALADPVVQLVTRDAEGREHVIVRAKLYDPAAWLEASRTRDEGLRALEAADTPAITNLDPKPAFAALAENLAPEHLTALAFEPRDAKKRRRKKNDAPANTLLEAVRGEALFIVFGPEPAPILEELLAGKSFAQSADWIAASESRHDGSVLLGHLPVGDKAHLDASLRVHDNALRFDVTLPEKSISTLLKPIP